MSTDQNQKPGPAETPRGPKAGADAGAQGGTPGPNAPASVGPDTDPGPETGGYDDHSPNRHPTNRKGGYGAG